MTTREQFDARYAKLANGKKQDAGADFRDRAKGALWGLVVGDCLGSPIQFTGKESHPWITEMVKCPVFNLPAGYWTDDGSMAMCIMDSYVRKGKYDLKDIGKTFVRWYQDGYLSSVDGRSFDVGNATAVACKEIAFRKSFVNGREESQGNGSIMRFAPSWFIARKLFAVKDEQIALMHDINDITHNSSVARKTITTLAEVFDEHIAAGRRTAIETTAKDWRTANNSGWGVSTLDTALWAFNTTSNFRDALVAAVNLGGDADTIGAVCGQIAGGFYGFSSIPKKWLMDIKDWERLDAFIDRFLDITL